MPDKSLFMEQMPSQISSRIRGPTRKGYGFNPFAEYDVISILMNLLSAEDCTLHMKYFSNQIN